MIAYLETDCLKTFVLIHLARNLLSRADLNESVRPFNKHTRKTVFSTPKNT